MNASLLRPPTVVELDAIDNMLMLTVRESQPHNHARMPALLAAGGVSGAFGRAAGYIERHLASDFGFADIAAAACCSNRQYRAAFGETPSRRRAEVVQDGHSACICP
jgi:transcriptional regulator GlxA family with amidase domain